MTEDTEDPYDIEALIEKRETSRDEYISTTNPVLRVLIDGVCDEECVLSQLNGLPHVVRDIWNRVVRYWKRSIKHDKAWKVCSAPGGNVYLEKLSGMEITFPKPKNIYINMMPFVMGATFEECKLPVYLKPYWDAILGKSFSRVNVMPEREIGKIGYLTIHESFVDANMSQRRGGLHTDCPGKLMIVPNESGEYICVGRVTKEEEENVCDEIDKLGRGYLRECMQNYTHQWGMMLMVLKRPVKERAGGIYMASNVPNSCAAWNCEIQADENGNEIIGHLGDVEHVRDVLPGEREVLEPNRLYWLSDRTPHESLPLKEGTYRQYFRLVTSEVSLWFEEHSTKNPHGVVPDPSITKIVKGSKFVDNLALLLDMDPGTGHPGKSDDKKRYELKLIFLSLGCLFKDLRRYVPVKRHGLH